MKPIAVTFSCLLLAASSFAETEIPKTNTQTDTNQGEVFELAPVVVTGYLWESELQSATASVSVLDEAQLELNGVQHFEDIVNTIPNVTWTGGSSRPRFIQIRGIGENSQFEGETPDSAVRFLIDDLDLTGVGTIGNLFDVQQVEVLRGPQAGAFGVNAAGGVVKIVTNDPTPYWTGQAEHTIGNDDLLETGIAVGGPILENDPEQLTFRFSLHNLTQNGFRKNRTLNRDDTNERDESTNRLKVRWLPNKDWQLDISLLYADFDNGYDEFTLNNSRTSTLSDEPGRDEQETFGSSIKAAYFGFDNVKVTYTAGYLSTDSFFSFDGDWGDGPTASVPFASAYDGFLKIDREREVITEDLRFESVDTENALGFIDRWTTGIYFERLEENTSTTGFGDFETDYLSNTLSIYGQAAHIFSKKTRMILGLRVEHFVLETEDLSEIRPDVDFDDWLFGGKLTFEHDLDKNKTFFASVTRGYKAGGANIYPFLASSLPTDYDTENLWNYEIGLRADWLDSRVQSQITLFYLDRDEAQLRDSGGTGIDFTYFTVNGDNAHHYGLEAETSWYLAEDLTLNFSAGLLETDRGSYTDPGDPTNRIEERDLSNAPSYTYTARINYQPADGFFTGIEAIGSDDYFESNSHPEKRDAYARVNGSVGYRWEQLTVTLWVKNLFDEEYAERVFFFDNGAGEQRYEAPAAPRTFGVTANYRW